MKHIFYLAILTLFSQGHAFVLYTNSQDFASTSSLVSKLHVYIPDGLSHEQWEKIKADEKKKNTGNLGKSGPRGFQSRSLQSFQQDLESGKASHLLPVFNAKEKLAKGEIKLEDVPYMQRGGNWDNSDLKGAKKLAAKDAVKSTKNTITEPKKKLFGMF